MWRLFRFLAVLAGLAAGVVIYTQVRHGSHPTKSEVRAGVFGICDVYRSDSAVDLDIRGLGADDACRSWIRSAGRNGEFWHETDVQATPGSSVDQACDLTKGSLVIAVYQAKSNFGTPGTDICASLVGQGWEESQNPQ